MIKEKYHFWPIISSYIGRAVSAHLAFPPMFYTLMSLVFALVGLTAAIVHFYVVAIFFFLVACCLDVVDGAVARAQNKSSHWGAFVDGVTDRFVDFAIIYSYFYFNITAPWLTLGEMLCLASFVVIMPSFVVAYANHRGAVNDDNETLLWRFMNRGEMVFMMLLVLVVSMFSTIWAGYVLAAFIVMATLTLVQTLWLGFYHGRLAKPSI